MEKSKRAYHNQKIKTWLQRTSWTEWYIFSWMFTYDLKSEDKNKSLT